MKIKKISLLQMILTFVLSLCLILSNILVVKSINLFGLPWLTNTCAVITFPITYVLSDVFSEVYGYKWSRLTANFAFFGTIITSVVFAIMISLPGNDSWHEQQALASILGSTPQIAISSVVAFWCGDLVNDKVFSFFKSKCGEKKFGFRAIISSVVGKYVDSAIFTMFGLNMLDIKTKITIIINAPCVQIAIELLLLPITALIIKKVKESEETENV